MGTAWPVTCGGAVSEARCIWPIRSCPSRFLGSEIASPARRLPLETYTRLQRPRGADAGLFRRVLKGLSCRDYEGCAEAVPEAFGLSPSTVSRRFIRASARKLKELCERPLQGYDFVGLVLDGKRFEDDLMVIALGITVQGEKVVLGFVQTGTENERALTAFFARSWWSGGCALRQVCSV